MKFAFIFSLLTILCGTTLYAQDNEANIKFEEKVIKLGKVKKGILLEFTYYFVNEGSVPLIINDAKVTCSCTVPKWPTYPVMAGARDSITVTFSTKGKYGYQDRDIEIISNSKKQSVFVSFRCNVLTPKTN